MFWISSSNEQSLKGSNLLFSKHHLLLLRLQKHCEQTKWDQRQSPHCRKSWNNNRNLRSKKQKSNNRSHHRGNLELVYKRGFLSISTIILLLCFPPVTLLQPMLKWAWIQSSSHQVCQKNPEERKKKIKLLWWHLHQESYSYKHTTLFIFISQANSVVTIQEETLWNQLPSLLPTPV